MEIINMRRLVARLAGGAIMGTIGGRLASAASFDFTFSSGDGVTNGYGTLIATPDGGGQYTVTSGDVNVNSPRFTTLTNLPLLPGTGVYANYNGDNLSYDNKLFVIPGTAPLDNDGIVFAPTSGPKYGINIFTDARGVLY